MSWGCVDAIEQLIGQLLLVLFDFSPSISVEEVLIETDLLVVGGMVLVIAWVMDEARKLEEEQALTI
jgi:hypothetical protein